MNVRLILDAIDALDEARRILRTGMGSVDEQMRVANHCSIRSFALKRALERECPEIKLREEA